MFHISVWQGCNISVEREMQNFSCGRQLNCEFNEWGAYQNVCPGGRQGVESHLKTQCFELKGHTWYLLMHEAECAVRWLSHRLHSSMLLKSIVHSWLCSATLGTSKS